MKTENVNIMTFFEVPFNKRLYEFDEIIKCVNTNILIVKIETSMLFVFINTFSFIKIQIDIFDGVTFFTICLRT